MPAIVSLAIVGLGRWGKVLVDSVQGRSEAVRFVAAVARHPARIQADAAARGLAVHGSLAAALAAPDIDGIVLATPHSQHAAEVLTCIAASRPVLVEKPFTLTVETAAECLSSARATGCLVAAAHNRRFLAPIVALRRMIADGELGMILHVETVFAGNAGGRYPPGGWRLAPGESPAGGLAGSGIHHIDSIIHLAGPIAQVTALTSRRVPDIAMDDTTAVLFRLRSGATASLVTLTATAPSYRIQVFGTRARADIEGAATSRADTLEITAVDGSSRNIPCETVDIERAELEAFAAAIRGTRPYPVAHAEVLNGIAAFEAVSLSVASEGPVAI